MRKGGALWGFELLLFRGELAVFAAKALDAAGGVNQFLLAGKKRVATRADFYVDIATVRGTGGKCASARAVHAHFVICGMNRCLHGFSRFLAESLILKDGRGIQQTPGARLPTPGWRYRVGKRKPG